MVRSLAQVRDLLLPGLWGMEREAEVDIVCDFTSDSLDIVTPGKRETLFTRQEIDNNSFEGQFEPRVKRFLGEP